VCVPEEQAVLVKDLQQFLGTFTDKLKGNAISTAAIYVEKDGFLEDIIEKNSLTDFDKADLLPTKLKTGVAL